MNAMDVDARERFFHDIPKAVGAPLAFLVFGILYAASFCSKGFQ